MSIRKTITGFFCLAFLLCSVLKKSYANPIHSKFNISDWRFGGGVGYSLYYTNQMDYKITLNYGNFKELLPSYYAALYKKIGSNIEVGIYARKASMLTLKSANTQGSQCDYTDAQINFQYSLNDNIGAKKGRFTYNAQIGLGVVNFRSRYFTVNPNTKDIDIIISSLGYGSVIGKKDIANKKTVIVGNLGMHLGYRLFPNMYFYWENSFNISTSNKMSGNLFKKSWIPPDCYFYTSVGAYFCLGNGGKSKRIKCPKF